MSGFWRGLLLLVVGLVALTGCGAGAVDEGAGGEDGSGQPQTRTIKHAMGTTKVTGRPDRVVVLDTGELDSAIALGVKPVGAVEAIPGTGFPSYLAEQAKGVEIVGSIEQPNLEKIASLRPDLILSSKLRHEAIYDQLAEIAPTVFTEEVGVTWKENFRLHAEALGRSEQASRLMRDYREQIAAFRQDMDDRLDETTVSVVRSVGSEVRIYMKASFIGTILEDAGLPRPKPQDKNVFSAIATPERIPDLEGEVMILAKYGDDHQLLKQLMSNPLWSRLEVVKRDRVYEVPDDLWFLGIGNLAARQVVDDLDTIFVENERLPGDQAER